MKDINTYGDLKEAVQLWLNRKDSTTIENIPMFINMALKQFARLAKLPYYEVLVSLEALDGFDYVNIPQDFLSAKHVSVNGIPYNRMDVESFQRVRNLDTQEDTLRMFGTGSKEHYFTRVGSQLRFIPSLKTGDIVEMIYQRDIPELKENEDEPYLLLVASDIMLYLSLRHASIFLRDPEQESYWATKAAEAAESLKVQLDEAEWSGSALVVPQFSR